MIINKSKGYSLVTITSDIKIKEAEINNGSGWVKRVVVNNSFYVKPDSYNMRILIRPDTSYTDSKPNK